MKGRWKQLKGKVRMVGYESLLLERELQVMKTHERNDQHYLIKKMHSALVPQLEMQWFDDKVMESVKHMVGHF